MLLSIKLRLLATFVVVGTRGYRSSQVSSSDARVSQVQKVVVCDVRVFGDIGQGVEDSSSRLNDLNIFAIEHIFI